MLRWQHRRQHTRWRAVTRYGERNALFSTPTELKIDAACNPWRRGRCDDWTPGL